VAGTAVRREAVQRLVEDVPVAQGADGGVLGRGVEAEKGQASAGP
jgi:hypothetical protein